MRCIAGIDYFVDVVKVRVTHREVKQHSLFGEYDDYAFLGALTMGLFCKGFLLRDLRGITQITYPEEDMWIVPRANLGLAEVQRG